MYRPSERVRPSYRDRSRSPARQASQHARFGSDAPAARYFSSRPPRSDSAPDSGGDGEGGDDDELDIITSRRRGPTSPRNRSNYYGVSENYRSADVPMSRAMPQERAREDFATKVAAFKLPGLPSDQQFESIENIFSSSGDEGMQRALAEPSNAINIYHSQYTGDGISEGSHSASLTVRHDAKGKASTLLRWLHVKQDVMSLEGFSEQSMKLPALPKSHRAAISKLLFEVKKAYSKPIWTSKNATVRHMAPGFHQVPIRPDKFMTKESRSTQDHATWFSMPYLSLEKYSGLEASSDPAAYPTPTLLQASYARIAQKRDMAQVVRQVGVGSDTSCFHIPQLWCIVVGESLLLTCGIMSEQELRGEMAMDAGKILPFQKAVAIVSEPPMEGNAKDTIDARILVRYENAVLWAFPARDCPTFFGFRARFREFWPRVVLFRYRGDIVVKETWESRVLHDMRTYKKDVVVTMEVSSATSLPAGTELKDEAFGVRHVSPRPSRGDRTHEKAERQGDTKERPKPTAAPTTSSDRQFHAFSWLKSEKHSPENIREGIQKSMSEIDSFFTSASNSPWDRKYLKAEPSLQSDVFAALERGQGQPARIARDDDEDGKETREAKIELYNSAKTLYNFFLPPNIVSKVSSKYWGAIKGLVSDEEVDTDAARYRIRSPEQHRNTRAILHILRRHVPQIIAFNELLNESSDAERSAVRIPGDLVQGWLLLVMGLIRAAADDHDWDDQVGKAMEKIQAGMSRMVASLPGPSLTCSALVLPMDLLSLMLPRLLSDSNGHRPGYSQIYSDYLQGLETEIMGMKSDISYQNRINLAQQEISVIRKILESQKSILRKLVLAQVDEPTVRAIRRRNRYDDDDDRDDDDRNENLQQDYKDWSRLSATDPRGLRMLLFRECAALLRGASQDFEEYEFQAGSLEQMNMNKVSVTKDRQEQLLYAFTVVTIIFLPMDTVSSIFGMNTADVRDMELTQWAFWAAAIPTGIAVILAALWMVGAYGELAAWLGKKFRAAGNDLVLEDRPPPYQRVVGEGILAGRRAARVAVQPRVYDEYDDEWGERLRTHERVTRRAGYRVIER